MFHINVRTIKKGVYQCEMLVINVICDPPSIYLPRTIILIEIKDQEIYDSEFNIIINIIIFNA